MKDDTSYSKIHTEGGYIIHKKSNIIDSSKINVILVIAGNPVEFEAYKKKHNPGIHSKDVLIYVANKFTVLGIESDYITVIGSGEKRIDFSEVLAASISTLM